MAKMKRNVGELVSGKIGPVVFFVQNGKSYARAAPNRKKDSWDEGQLRHRDRISNVGSLWRAIRSEEIKKIWKLADERRNGYALFMKANMPAFGIDGKLIDPLLLKVSAGKLNVPLHLKAERHPENQSAIAVSWKNEALVKKAGLDDELMVISRSDDQYSLLTATGLTRSVQAGVFELPILPANAKHIYLFFVSTDREECSESVCFEI